MQEKNSHKKSNRIFDFIGILYIIYVYNFKNKNKKMKKIWIFILWLCSLSLGWNFTQANNEYEYTNLDITANILIDGTINVKENFTANFFTQKHGIIRDIPLNYTVWWKKFLNFTFWWDDFHIDISNINVQWKKFTTSKNNWEIEIKIWDANKTVIGKQKYPISYTTYWLIRNFSGMWYAELYWNLVWYDFDTNIKKVKAELILPKVYTWFTADDFLITTGWKTTSVKNFWWTVNWKNWDKIIITYDKWLPAYQWITLAIKFPNDYFKFDHNKQANLVGHVEISLLGIIKNFILRILGIGWVIFLIVFGLKKISKNNKNNTNSIDRRPWALKWDFANQFPVIVQYNPPKWVNCAEAWLLLHRRAKPKDILSLVYKRAAEWLISFSVEYEEDLLKNLIYKDVLVITKNKNIPEGAPEYEKEFFKSIIHGKKNKITESSNIYSKLPTATLEKYGRTKWWLKSYETHDENFVIWLILFVISCIFMPILWDNYPIVIFIWILIIFCPPIILCVLAYKMMETEKWAKLISHILWYKKFLEECDENKLRLFLQQDPLYFDKILPYAVVFWLDTELIKKIEPIMQEMNIKSSWYNWDVHTMNIINNTISSVASHSRYSSSDGHSGWSSFGWWGGWFSSWWGWGGWGWRSW